MMGEYPERRDNRVELATWDFFLRSNEARGDIFNNMMDWDPAEDLYEEPVQICETRLESDDSADDCVLPERGSGIGWDVEYFRNMPSTSTTVHLLDDVNSAKGSTVEVIEAKLDQCAWNHIRVMDETVADLLPFTLRSRHISTQFVDLNRGIGAALEELIQHITRDCHAHEHALVEFCSMDKPDKSLCHAFRRVDQLAAAVTNSIELFRALRSNKTFEAFGVMNVNCFVAACASEFVDWLLDSGRAQIPRCICGSMGRGEVRKTEMDNAWGETASSKPAASEGNQDVTSPPADAGDEHEEGNSSGTIRNSSASDGEQSPEVSSSNDKQEKPAKRTSDSSKGSDSNGERRESPAEEEQNKSGSREKEQAEENEPDGEIPVDQSQQAESEHYQKPDNNDDMDYGNVQASTVFNSRWQLGHKLFRNRMGRPLFRADDDGSYATLPHDVVANKELLRTLHEMQIKKLSSFFKIFKILHPRLLSEHMCVFECQRLATAEVFDVKIISLLNDTNGRHEVDALFASRGNQHTVQMVETLRDGSFCYIVLELLLGKNLMDQIRVRGEQLSEEMARDYFRQILEGVRGLHSNGFVHCALTPSRIMCADHKLVKIFDLSHATPVSALVVNALSTPHVAPEVSDGQPVDFPRDLWSLGAILYEMLVGTPPFTSPTNGASPSAEQKLARTAQQIKNGNFDRSSVEYCKLLKQAKEVIESLLQPNPKDRPILEQLLEDEWVTTVTKKKKV